MLVKTSLWQKLHSWLLPACCVLCAALTKRSLALCHACERELPWLNTVCMHCALPLEGINPNDHMLCGHCLQQQPPFFSTTALFHYQPPIDQFIMALKFNQQLLYARLLGELLAENRQKKNIAAHLHLPEMIIPMPLHPQRLRERGFNQALEIARPVARKLQLPLDLQSCERIRVTASQSTLPAAERHQNVKNAFKISSDFKSKHVAIIDDVVTTGHTVTEFSHALQQAGVERIEVWCVARTGLVR